MERLRRQNAALAEKARHPEALGATPEQALLGITELAAQTLEVARVSV